MLNIITSFYIPANDLVRENELKIALNNNLSNPIIKKIHLFLDKSSDEDYIKTLSEEKQKKIKIIEIGKQPLYSDFFKYANTLPNEYCMISNSDIWVHTDTIPFFFSILSANIVFVLTRHEMTGKIDFIEKNSTAISHDAFLFKSQLNPKIQGLVKHKQNLWGSENSVINALLKCRYKLFNPCVQFKIIHQHDMDRPNRIEPNRGRLFISRTTVSPSYIFIQNNMIQFKQISNPRFRMGL